MNDTVLQLYGEYMQHTGDKAAAASLALADVLLANKEASAAGVPTDRPLSVAEAAKLMHVAPNTVYELCAKGGLAHHRIGRAIRIAPGDIDAFQAQAAKTARPGRDKYKWLR